MNKRVFWVIACDECGELSDPIRDPYSNPSGAPEAWASENGWDYKGEPGHTDLCPDCHASP